MDIQVHTLGAFVARLNAAGVPVRCPAPAVSDARILCTLNNRTARITAYALARELTAQGYAGTGAAEFIAAMNLRDGELNQTDPDQLQQELNDEYLGRYYPKLNKLVQRIREKGHEVRVDRKDSKLGRMVLYAYVTCGNLLPVYAGDAYLNEEGEEQYDVAADVARWLK